VENSLRREIEWFNLRIREMKKTKIALLLMVTLLILGARGRYSSIWKRVSGGVAYDKGSVTAARAFNYAVDTASDDDYLADVSGITSYTSGLVIWLNPVTDNTGACTLNINSLGAKSLKTVLGADPGDSHIDAAQIVPLCYDGTNFVIMTPDSNP